MNFTTVIECPDCGEKFDCEPRALRINYKLSCPACGLNFSCTHREIRQALDHLSSQRNL